MMKWGYVVRYLAANLPMAQERLNKLGEEGWQLVAIDRGYGYFSRQVREISGANREQARVITAARAFVKGTMPLQWHELNDALRALDARERDAPDNEEG